MNLKKTETRTQKEVGGKGLFRHGSAQVFETFLSATYCPPWTGLFCVVLDCWAVAVVFCLSIVQSKI